MTITSALPARILASVFTAVFATPLWAGDLSVNVASVRNDTGMILIALHDGAEGFPGTRKPIAVQSVPAKQGGVRVVFGDLAPGTYATTLFHDENGDGALDSNLVGMPTEGIAFSNDATGSFGPASFDDAAFVMPEGDLNITTTVSY
ncbi:MAG: DUF2141 domain-containing protein [Pikeienuella sp.]